MLIKEFTQINSFVDSFGELENFSFHDPGYAEFMDMLHDNCQRLKEKLDKQLDKPDTNEKLGLLVNNVRGKLTSLVQDIYVLYDTHARNGSVTNAPKQQIIFELGQEVMQMLVALRKNFNNYFHADSLLPTWISYTETVPKKRAPLITHGLSQRGVSPCYRISCDR